MSSFSSFALVVLVLASACADDECPQVARCDVSQRDCQQSVMKAVACMRHSEAPLPKVSVIDRAQYRERLIAESESESDAQDAADYAVWNRGLALFSLAPAHYDAAQRIDDEVAQIAAEYLPETKEILVISDTEGTAQEQIETFAHEAVHALQDAELDLQKYTDKWSTNYDSALATHALIEGEAVHYQVLVAIQLAGRRTDELDWESLYTRWREETLQMAEADEAPVALAHLRFSYAFGGGFVSQHWLARGRAGIDQLLAAPPRTTREMMFDASGDDLKSAQKQLDEHSVPVLPEGFTMKNATSLGAWITRIFAARMRLAVWLRLVGAREVAVDRFSVHFDQEHDMVTSAWRVRMGDEGRALDWPALAQSASLANNAVESPDGNEAFAVIAEDDPQPDPRETAWADPSDVAAADEMDNAAIALPPLFGHASHAFSCKMQRPSL